MRAVSWLLGVLASLIVLAAAAAWFIPPMLDWTRYRGEIVALASGTLGRSVRIDGPISLELLPQPLLTASSVSVDEGEAAITVRVLRLRVGLWPLLRGRIAARELVMRDFDMRVPWPIPTPSEPARRPEWLSAISARIEHGRVAIGDLTMTDIDASLSTGVPNGTVAGSYAASGTARLSGKLWHFSMRMTQPGGDGSVGLDVALDGQGAAQGIGATLSGQIDGEGTLGGRVTARGPDLSALLPAPAVPFKADGRVTIAGGLAAADDLTVEIGGSPARGAVALRVSPALRLDVALAASRLDLDAWLPTVLSGAGLAVPTGIDLSAEAAQLAGGTLRRLRGAFDIDRAGVDVRDIRAVLPGEATMQLSGRITHPTPASPHFEGDATLAAPALRTTLSWLEGAGFGSFSALPEGVLHSAELTGHAMLDREQLAVGAMSGQIDGTRVDGTIAIRPGRRLALSAALRADRIDLDRWVPAKVPSLAAIPGVLSAIDADIQIEAATAVFRGLDIKPFSLDAMVDGGQVTLRRLEGRSRDVQLIASGTLVEGGRIADGRVDLQARQASTLGDLWPEGLLRHAPALLRAPMTVQVQASGPPDHVAVHLGADFGDLRLEVHPIVDVTSGKWSGPMTLRHPGAPRLAEMAGLLGAPAWLGDGSFALVARVSGDNAHLAADDLDITAGALHATARLAVDASGPDPLITGKLIADTLPLPLPYVRSPEPLPLAGLGGWTASISVEAGRVLAGSSPLLEHLAATVSLADRTLRVDRITARLAGGELTGAVALGAGTATPTLTVTAMVKGAAISGPLFDLPLDIAAGAMDGALSMSATGYSPAALLATLHGTVGMTVHDGEFVGFDLVQAARDLTEDKVRAALAGGSTTFDALTLAATADRGNLTLGESRMTAAAGEVTASGTLNLPGASADLHFQIRPAVPEPPEIGLRLTGLLGALERTPELAGITRWRLARAQPAFP